MGSFSRPSSPNLYFNQSINQSINLADRICGCKKILYLFLNIGWGGGRRGGGGGGGNIEWPLS